MCEITHMHASTRDKEERARLWGKDGVEKARHCTAHLQGALFSEHTTPLESCHRHKYDSVVTGEAVSECAALAG